MQIPEIAIDKAKEHFDEKSAVFLDIRDEQSFEQSHIPGASRLSEENLNEFIDTHDKEKMYVVYCYRGHSSLSACAFLINCGFKNVFSMAQGFNEWKVQFPEEN